MKMKIIAFLSAFTLTVCSPSVVYADCYVNNNISVYSQALYGENSGISANNLYSDITSDSIIYNGNYNLTYPIQRGLSLPTSSHNLEDSNYTANIVQLGARWLYTNKFFYCSSNGRLYVKYNVSTSSANGHYMRIGVYDLTTDTSYTDFKTNVLPASGKALSGQMYFSRLNPDHQYAICFLSVSDDGTIGLISGTAQIGHNYL